MKILTLLLGVLAFGFYLRGVSPAPYGGDSGELIASAAALGVSHAPGYPLHAVLGKAVSVLVPFGGLAYRVNLLSAALSAVAVALLFLLIIQLTGIIPAALAGAFVYAALPLVWDQSQVAEVFALNNAIAVALCVVWQMYLQRKKPPFFFAFAFLLGIGLANHQTLLLMGPGFLVWSWKEFFPLSSQ